ncbi:hypothetical protein [Salipiger mangrovisoli]|uniref:hypothetical protein n=1 Tax=Salipiger mangrovisoli TaxID=2865933 RepID=UPI0018815D45|nr:hypothetical protein [Salipiger mangrovisoli]
MAGDIRHEKNVQRKVARSKEYFFFRLVRKGKELRRSLPHPFDAEYRAAYNAAHHEAFGTVPGEFESPKAIARLIRDHKDSARYARLPKASRLLRDYALDLMADRWGAFDADQIRPIHVQAVYDSLSDRPATANRRLDDMSAVFSWGRTRGFADDNPCRRIERVHSEETHEPWPDDRLEILIGRGKRHIVKIALVALYTGQRRADVIGMCETQIRDGIWTIEQGKTGNPVTVPLHPVVLAIIEEERAARRKAQIVAPRPARVDQQPRQTLGERLRRVLDQGADPPQVAAPLCRGNRSRALPPDLPRPANDARHSHRQHRCPKPRTIRRHPARSGNARAPV